MKLTLASSYAIHTLVYLARKQAAHPITSEQIARAQGIPTKFLTKVLKPLVAGRMLRTVMGPGGGYQLARPATQIALLEVVEAVDGPIRAQIPFTSPKNTPLDRHLEAVCQKTAEEVRRDLQKVRISDLAKRK
jgi:Rrf2 family protein